jgi:hypothetical protein
MKKVLLAVLLLLAFPLASYATPFTASSGNLAAPAGFSLVGGNLQVTLTNTSRADISAPGQVLTAVFFDVEGVGGLQYRLTSAGDNPLTGNTPVTEGSKGDPPTALMKNSVVFLLSGPPLDFDRSAGNIKKASFQYGPALTDRKLPVRVPEPATMLLLGIGLIVIGAFGRKKFIR